MSAPEGRMRWSTDGGIHRIPLPDVSGELWLCGKHHIGPDVEAVRARVAGATVVCLTQRHELTDRYPDYVRWLDEHVGTRAVWFPIHDLSAPDADRARPFIGDLVTRLRGGERLIVHCAAGIGRAGTVAVAVCVLLGLPVDVALAHVRAHRPLAGPEAGTQLELIHQLAAGTSGDGDLSVGAAEPVGVDDEERDDEQ